MLMSLSMYGNASVVAFERALTPRLRAHCALAPFAAVDATRVPTAGINGLVVRTGDAKGVTAWSPPV